MPFIWNATPLWRKKLSSEQRNANINLTQQRRLFEDSQGEKPHQGGIHTRPCEQEKQNEEREKKKLPELNGLLWDWAWQPGESSLRRSALSYLSCLWAARGLVRSTGVWTLWTANHLRTALFKHYFFSLKPANITFRFYIYINIYIFLKGVVPQVRGNGVSNPESAALQSASHDTCTD